QGALSARRRAVDLVGEDDVGDDRARPELELALLLVVEVDAGDVGGHHVRRELDALEAAPNRPRDRLRQRGLAYARHVLEEDVPVGKEGYKDQVDSVVLADHDAGYVRLHSIRDLADGARCLGCAIARISCHEPYVLREIVYGLVFSWPRLWPNR